MLLSAQHLQVSSSTDGNTFIIQSTRVTRERKAIATRSAQTKRSCCANAPGDTPKPNNAYNAHAPFLLIAVSSAPQISKSSAASVA